MDIEELYEEIKKVKEWIDRTMLDKNRTGELDDFLIQIGYKTVEEENLSSEMHALTLDLSKTKILVLGDSECRVNDLKGVAKSLGISSDMIDFELDYEKITNMNVQNYQYSNRYSDIIVGPVGHKAKGINGSNSLIDEIENHQDIYPLLSKACLPGGKLKITNSTFREALKNTLIYGKYISEMF